jgi:alpha-galactosidase
MYKKLVPSFVLSIIVCFACFAQSEKQIVINTQHTSLVFSVGKNGKLYQRYLGSKISSRLPFSAEAMEAYIPSGTDNQFEPALRVVHADGNPSLELKYSADATVKSADDIAVTRITLNDPVYAVEVVLQITAYDKEDIFKIAAEIENHEKTPVTLTDFASAMLHFNANKYILTQFHGNWAKEVQMEQSELTSGIKIIDSKLGTRPNIYQTPTFFVSLNKPAEENTGELVAGTLAWTGNFQFKFEVDEKNALRVIAGINPFASLFVLKPGNTFKTPEFIFTYSNQGKGQASRNFHDWARNYAILDGKEPRLTLLNNWETTYFDFNNAKLSALFDDASKLGVDMFLLDDGWFGNKYPRNDDRAGLGDWEPMKSKLPDGIAHLVKEAEGKGVKFGIWIEPEMINPKSELYEQHPDWVLKLPNRPEDYFRNQLVLDLINPKVQDFVFKIVDDLFTKNPGLAYIKWDCNRMFTNAYSPYLKNDQSTLFIDYTRSLYKVLDRIRAKYPHVPMMLCSGGGGRTDYGMLKYFNEFWPSDDTEPVERVYIQWGYSYFFPSLLMCNHITSWGKETLKFKTDVAMMGKMGYDINIHQLTPEELAFSQQAVKEYKRISAIIWQGDLYRLVSPYDEHRAVLMYVNKEKSKSILFAYNLHARFQEKFIPVQLLGLDAQKQYKITEINLMPGKHSAFAVNGNMYSGEYLMKAGIKVSTDQELTSAVFEINEQ